MKRRSSDVCRLALGAILVVAGAMKLVHPADFFVDLLGFHVAFPELFLRVVAVALPWLEVLTGGALLLDVWPETVRPVVAALCFVFVVMLGQAVWRGLDLRCGCFGSQTWAWFERPTVALVRALALLVAAMYLTLQRRPTAAAMAE